MGELLGLICRAPFPFNVGGLVLKRIPSPWDNRALAIILILLGILIVHPLFPPITDFSLWLYYRVIRGPEIQVNFSNYSGKRATIGKEFTFWISENKKNNRDSAINGIRAMPKGAITIDPKKQKTVYIRLGRDREIHRLYGGGGYLRLRFDVGEEDKKEVEDYCSTVISEGLTLVISDPSYWTSLPIAIWFSEAEDSKTNKDYLDDDVFKAISMIEEKLNVFRILAIKPIESDEPVERSEYSKRNVLNIKVGCYRTKGPGDRLRLKIIDEKDKVKAATIEELYEDLNISKSLNFTEDILKRLREQILEGYPPRGIIDGVQPEKLSSVENARLREISINIGRFNGIRRGDSFNVLSMDQDRVIGRAKVTHVTEQGATANLISDSEEVMKGCRVEWKNTGG